jgi:hypothetical protein
MILHLKLLVLFFAISDVRRCKWFGNYTATHLQPESLLNVIDETAKEINLLMLCENNCCHKNPQYKGVTQPCLIEILHAGYKKRILIK